MSQRKNTISTIFLVPTLKIPKDLLIDNGFINGYAEEESGEHNYPFSVHLLFKPKNLDKFREFLEGEYERTKDVIEDYDFEDYIVVVYKLNKKFQKDFELIHIGKYSHTSPEFQKLFPASKKILTPDGLHRDEISLQIRIFKKTEDLQSHWIEKLGMTNEINKWNDSFEVWEGFNIEKETLNFNKLKELV